MKLSSKKLNRRRHRRRSIYAASLQSKKHVVEPDRKKQQAKDTCRTKVITND